MYFTCPPLSRNPAREWSQYVHVFSSSFILLDLVSYHFPWSGRNKLSFFSSCLMEFFPSCNLLLLKLVLPYPIPSPLPGARRVKWLQRDMIYGKKEYKSYQYTTFKMFSWFYLNLWYEKQFRGALYNVGQLRVYGEWSRAVLFCTL